MIELNNISKIYKGRGVFKKKTSTVGVEGLSLQIGAGAFGLLGINGAGKTTTLKMIATLLRPTSGMILIDGKDTRLNERNLRSRINMITGSDRMLYFRLSGRENLHYFASLYGMGYREAKMRSDYLLDLTGLGGAADKRVEEYSRGMKQRLSIARGLVNDPSILLLDEPTLGLDISIAAEIRSFIKEVLLSRNDRTIILTSHYMSEIEELCPDIGILQNGRLIYRGSPGGLYSEMGLEEQHFFNLPAEYLCRKNDIERLVVNKPVWFEEADGSLRFSMTAEDGYTFLKHMDSLQLKGIKYSQEKPGLEEAVLRLTEAAK